MMWVSECMRSVSVGVCVNVVLYQKTAIAPFSREIWSEKVGERD